jgi:hypothetical protein
MKERTAIFDVVGAIQAAEREALDSLGARTVVEARERRRAAKALREAKRWTYVQLRANAGAPVGYGAVTEEEKGDSEQRRARGHAPDPDPSEDRSMLRKLLKW